MSGLNNLKLHYFTVVRGSTTMGRGEYVRLLIEDAGLDFEFVRHNAAEWKEKKQELLAQGIRGPTLPYIEVDGKYYGKTVPIMRFISKKLGKYEGANDDEEQLLDAYADMIMDWAQKWATTTFQGTEETVKTYETEYVPQVHKTWNDILSDVEGPFVLGDRITYVDFALFHILEDDNKVEVNAEQFPHLAKFVQAVQARPNLSKYLATKRD